MHLLADEIAPEPGARRLTWDFRDVEGEQQPAGAYILRVSIDGKSTSHIAYRTDR